MKALIAGLIAVCAIVLAAVLIADGGEGGSSDTEQTDDDFVALMSEHHELAIEMAEMAQERGQHAKVKQLADAIVGAQTAEIEQMAAIHERMSGEGIEGHQHGNLGMSEAEMGMHADMSAFESAGPKQFDRVFIDSMIPHHQGAIRMARAVLENGDDEEVAELAEAIIEAQSAEIEQMNAWRMAWYGAESPAGGVPSEGESEVPSHETMGH